MATELGTAYIPVEADFHKFDRQLTTATSGARHKFSGLTKGIAVGAAAGIAYAEAP